MSFYFKSQFYPGLVLINFLVNSIIKIAQDGMTTVSTYDHSSLSSHVVIFKANVFVCGDIRSNASNE